MKKILMLLPSERFRDIEYLVPRAFFEQNNFIVKTVSSAKISKGRFGYVVNNDFSLDEITQNEFDGIYMVGGGGSLEYLDNAQAKFLVESFYKAGKPVAAICAAPRNLVNWGMLKGKKVTAHNGDGTFPAFAKEHAAIPCPENTTVLDAGILTANGPEASEESALAFMKMFE